MRTLVFGLVLGAVVVACSSGSDSSTSGAPLGAICAKGDECATQSCFLFGTGYPFSGLCGALCAVDADCGAGAACVNGAGGGAPGCIKTCASDTDCAAGVPCRNNDTVGGGICWPLAPDVCSRAAGQPACTACLGASCCTALTGCLDELACGKVFDAHCEDTSCTGALAAGDAAAKALATCATTSCATECGAM